MARRGAGMTTHARVQRHRRLDATGNEHADDEAVCERSAREQPDVQRTDLRLSAASAGTEERTAMIPAMTTGICARSQAIQAQHIGTHDALHDKIGPEDAHRRDTDLIEVRRIDGR